MKLGDRISSEFKMIRDLTLNYENRQIVFDTELFPMQSTAPTSVQTLWVHMIRADTEVNWCRSQSIFDHIGHYT